MSEPISSQILISPNQYYTMEMLKETVPFLNEVGYYVLYNRINEQFIDKDEYEQNKKIIERLKKSHEIRLKPALELLHKNKINT